MIFLKYKLLKQKGRFRFRRLCSYMAAYRYYMNCVESLKPMQKGWEYFSFLSSRFVIFKRFNLFGFDTHPCFEQRVEYCTNVPQT